MSVLDPTATCATPITKAQRNKSDTEQSYAAVSAPPSDKLTTFTAVEALEVSTEARHRLAQLLLSAPSWTEAEWSHSPMSTASGDASQQNSDVKRKLTPQNYNSTAASLKSAQTFQTPRDATETLYRIKTTLEDTQYLLVTCLDAVYASLSRQGSARASAAASCGISHSSSPYNVHPSARNALRAYDANVPIEVACGSVPAAAQSIPIISGYSAKTEAEAQTPAPREEPSTQFVQKFVTKQPSRMQWPPAQFCYVVHVEFKRGRVRRFFSRVSVKPANYALVPGDRGYDCGLVIQCALWNPHKHAFDVDTIQSLDAEVWPAGNHGTILEVIRLATEDEVHRLHNDHVSMERLALNTCRDVAARLGLPMQVLDCEYQYDGTKISFFFDSTKMIDFRQLNKELYRIFNARIWMQNTNGAVRNAAPPNAATSQRWRDHHGHPCTDA